MVFNHRDHKNGSGLDFRPRRHAASRQPPAPFHAALLLLLVLSSSFRPSTSKSYGKQHSYRCSPDEGGGVCPVGSYCCRVDDGNVTTSRCMHPRARKGTCCASSAAGGNHTFCYSGYECADDGVTCRLSNQSNKTEGMVDETPQFLTCPGSSAYLEPIYGMSLLNPDDAGKHGDWSPQLPYFSSHGDLSSIPFEQSRKLQAAVVMVQGRRRMHMAATYFCSAIAASRVQDYYPPDSVLVVALWFRSRVEYDTPNLPAIPGQKGPEYHWVNYEWGRGEGGVKKKENENRATPILRLEDKNAVTSFQVLDNFLDVLADPMRFPNLDVVSFSGLCTGGELLQRWSIFSNHPAWKDTEQNANGSTKGKRQSPDNGPRIRIAPLGLSESAYTSPRRFIHGQWTIPPPEQCRQYNSYPYGLGNIPESDTQLQAWLRKPGELKKYLAKAVLHVGSKEKLILRHANRDLMYISMLLDNVHLSKELDKLSCSQELQGEDRVVVNDNLLASLTDYFGQHAHKLLTVPGIDHEHAWPLQHQNGTDALFGGDGFCKVANDFLYVD